MKHKFFSDGNSKRVSWVIWTDDSTVEQEREQAENYLDQVTNEQSKYIALHVGIFWGIGRFIIKNGDTVDVMLDLESMFNHLKEDATNSDSFIEARTGFIKQLIDQRKLDIHYYLIESKDNLASKLL